MWKEDLNSKQVVEILKMNGIKIDGLFDDSKAKNSIFHNEYLIIDRIENAKKYLQDDDTLFCGIGDNTIREQIVRSFSSYKFINCISPLSHVSPSAKIIGSGNYIGNFTNIMPNTSIDSFNFLNDGCIICHDTIINSFNHFAPHSCLTGNVTVGNSNLIGANSTIIPKIKIGSNNIIGACSVIIRDIMDNSTIVGNPGRKIEI